MCQALSVTAIAQTKVQEPWVRATVGGQQATGAFMQIVSPQGGKLVEARSPVAGVVEIRGEGLMLGIELDRPCGEILTRAMQAGLLLSVTADTVVRLVPPLILTVAEADEIVSILVPLIQAFLSGAESLAA